MPPRRKKTKAVTMKRRPMVLWSTSSASPRSPGGLLQVRSSAARSRSSDAPLLLPVVFALANSPVSLQALQVIQQRLQVVRLKEFGGIRTPGLICCGSTTQPARCSRVFGSARATAAGCRSASGRGRPRRRRPSPGSVAHDARRRRKTCRPRACSVVAARRRACAARRTRLELSRASATTTNAMNACWSRRTRRTGRGTSRRGRPEARSSSRGPGSGPACRAGSAPRSCGSRRRRELEPHRPADRDVDLVGRGDDVARPSGRHTATSHHH